MFHGMLKFDTDPEAAVDLGWLGDPDIRTLLLLITTGAVICLLTWMSRLANKQAQNVATIAAVADLLNTMQGVLVSQQDTIDKGVQALVELNGHVEVTHSRTRLSRTTRELLDAATAEQQKRHDDPPAPVISS